jgi:hypothetical protein
MRQKRRPGRSGKRHRSNETSRDGDLLTRPENGSLAVELSSTGQPSAAELELIATIMRQLPPMLAEPRIMILLMPPKHPIEWDAQNVANQSGEPVAIADMKGELLAYRQPQ